MNTEQLYAHYYFTKEYKKKSDTEFTCKVSIKKRNDDAIVTSIGNNIDFFETEQTIQDSEFAIAQITWEDFLNETIIMLFNLLIFRINLEDPENIDGRDSIATYFDEDPFY
ncbi:MAG: hypothetical protein RL108_1896 [Bacteroidota bacterium]|jgi:hypothetical protein